MEHSNDSSSNEGSVYYFGYGPMVHPTVRHRRGVKVMNEQAAILTDHRLTFAYGGVASVVKQRGYDVHGIVMQCQSTSDWEKLKESEGGYYATELEVFPYGASNSSDRCEFSPEDDDDDSDDDSSRSGATAPVQPIRAHVFVMLDFDAEKLEKPLERLPQERYLRLIATGMQKYGLDEDYISYSIMGVPFKPSRKPGNYATFPVLPELLDDASPPPKISLQRYKRLCNSEQVDRTVHLFFIVGRHVVLIRNHEPGHPGATWFLHNGFGRDDVTFYLHQTHVDSDIVPCETAEDVTPSTQAWAENLLCESIAFGLTAHKVMEVVEDDDEGDAEDVEQLLAMLLTPSSSHAAATTDSCEKAKSESKSRSRRTPGVLKMMMRGMRKRRTKPL
uniref:gamma-glutamylcyclotransferase n=1 Tax=Grammatophora oceanica TaxID=210454 RepID=A0A7S1UWI2_9STRA|mmetsp:Transcript_27116/g.39707  ORF Transcript_27116/g.39707 Transcript_27116/m.39707 type:complete len:389 (+) Transcript_27116:277-1443(+)|eukprot:CAMPEP_0194059246 /NCGR_PEP_ID=MMETSP0009_2-20130614/68467_1 /TAXON_ID=210454 /ORGANISM="Grammatophora oceanica, Strain CCMP 410" /LENGTH=388 /DNA_ID=CAMNT_0038709705 /DNA_START=265 /DNA_END=1431 /DNA_ORIENTATION=+